jgi:hypothetical protein
MAGQIKQMLDAIIAQRSKGNAILAMTTRTKIVLKGVDPDRYGGSSPDDPVAIARVKQIASELGVSI